MIKGALFDIDDTLYSHKLEAFPTLTLKALKKLREKGIKIGFCTSRLPGEMSAFPSILFEITDCQIFGTGVSTLVQDQYYKSYTLDKNDVKKFIDYFKSHNISYHYEDINTDVFYWGDTKPVEEGKRCKLSKKTGRLYYKEYEDEEITNLFFHDASVEDIEYIQNINPNLYISRWGRSGNISPEFVDKSFGLLKFCQMFSLTPDEVIAFGDGSNDDLMLEMAGIGVCVKGGKENALKASDYVTNKVIEDGGIYETLVDLKIIEEDEYKGDAFFFDIDGTLFDHESNCIHELTYESLMKLKQNNKLIVVNTSRTEDEMFNVPARLIEIADVLAMAAGSYIKCKDEVLIKTLPLDLTLKAINYLEEHHMVYRYATTDGKGYLNVKEDLRSAIFKRLYDMIPDVKKYENEEVVQLLCYGNIEEIEGLKKIVYPELGVSILHNEIIEIYPKNTDKGTAISDVCKKYHIDEKNTVSFGDSNNDIDQIRKANLGIVMGNGTLSAKQEANYITDSIKDEGINKALIRFGFIK